MSIPWCYSSLIRFQINFDQNFQRFRRNPLRHNILKKCKLVRTLSKTMSLYLIRITEGQGENDRKVGQN